MKRIFQNNILLVLIFIVSNSFAQKGNYEIPAEIPFQPMFSFGAGYHNFQGNIVGTETSSLVGNIGYTTGIRLNLFKDWYGSLLFSTVDFYEKNVDLNQEFRSNFNAIGLHVDYMWNFIPFFKRSKVIPYNTIAIQRINFTTSDLTNNISYEKERGFTAPIGIGLAFNVSERILLQVAYQHVMGFSDIDKSGTEEADNFNLVSFNVSYDFFTRKPQQIEYIDDSYYQDVNFALLDLEDSDGDKVIDIDDYCPKTPNNVTVNDYGCPIDKDNDGIADYIDKEKNTRKGSLVDEYGVTLTQEKYYSMYSENEVASREYANFYNQFEIQRENFTNTNDYLIAKANAFNKVFYTDENKKESNNTLQYKVQLGMYKDGIPASIINTFLSLDDLESIQQEDGNIIYAVGGYAIIDDAINKQYKLEEKGFDIGETKIIVDNNGVVSDYVPPAPKIINSSNIITDTVGGDTLEASITITEEKLEEQATQKDTVIQVSQDESVPTVVYRIQIGAYKQPLDKIIFKGVENVISYKSKDDLIRYTTGSFSKYADAINYLREMRARGFEDAFISTYKNGERIGLDMAIKQERSSIQKDKKDKNENKLNVDIRFLVQIGVLDREPSGEKFNSLNKDITKEKIGPTLYRYFAGSYSTLYEAKEKLKEVQDIGFKDAFILARKDGERISIEEAQKLLK